MERPVKVACAQVEPVVLDREATLDKLETVAGEAAREGAELVVFPETFVPVYPSSLWAKAFAGWEAQGAKETFARLAQESVAVGSPAERRIAAVAQELGIWIVTGVNEVEPERPGTIGRGGSAILAPDGLYLAGPLYDEEAILYAELDPARLLAERQRFDPVGHYSRPDVLQLTVRVDGAPTSTRPSARSSRP